MIFATKEVGLVANADKTKYMVTSRDENAGRSQNIEIANSSLEKVKHFKCLVKTLSDQKYIQKGIKSRLKSGNACYHSVQNLLYSTLLSKHFEIGLTEL